jgi:hypothetical protein
VIFQELQVRSPAGLGPEREVARIRRVGRQVQVEVLEPEFRPLIELLFCRDFDARIGVPPGKRVRARAGSDEAVEAAVASLGGRGMAVKPVVRADINRTIVGRTPAAGTTKGVALRRRTRVEPEPVTSVAICVS